MEEETCMTEATGMKIKSGELFVLEYAKIIKCLHERISPLYLANLPGSSFHSQVPGINDWYVTPVEPWHRPLPNIPLPICKSVHFSARWPPKSLPPYLGKLRDPRPTPGEFLTLGSQPVAQLAQLIYLLHR